MATWESEFTTPGSSARIWLVLQVDLVSQDIANNTSTLNWYLRMEERVNASPFNNNPTSTASADVNGTVWSSGGLTYDFNLTNETIGVASGTTVVTHDADGSKTIGVGAAYNGGNPLGTASFGSTYALPTIPRATQPTVSPVSGNTGATYTIGHSPATSSFYHDIAYSVDGGANYTNIVTNLVGTDVSTDWTPAHSLLPDSTSPVGGSAIIRLITRASSGGTIIGTKYVSLPLTVPASVKPTISAVAWADAQTSAPDMPTLMGGAGRFVQRWSKLRPTVTSAGASGSTVTDTDIIQNGQTTDSGVAFGLPIALSGAVPYTAYAYDSRSRTSDPFVSTVAVTAYNFPNLPTPTVQRTSDAGGTTPSPTGTFLKITPNASVSSLNFSGEKNLLEWQVRTRPVGGSWTTVQAWTAATVSGVTWTTPKIISGYAASTEYEVEVSVRDLFGKNGYDTGNTISIKTALVPSENVFMDWDKGIGIGLGKYRQNGILDVNGDIYQNGSVVLDQSDDATTSQMNAGTSDATFVTPLNLLARLPFAVADLNALPTASNFVEGTRIHVDALNVDFFQQDGVWRQNGIAYVANYSTMTTEYAKAAGGYRNHHTSMCFVEDRAITYEYLSSVVGAAAWYPVAGVFPAVERIISANVTSDGTNRTLDWNTAGAFTRNIISGTDGTLELASGVFTVRQRGRWKITSQITFTTGGTFTHQDFYKNGSLLRRHQAVTSAASYSTNVLVYEDVFAAGDTFRTDHNAGAALQVVKTDGGDNTHIIVEYMGPG
jgi:hypothetical protein